MSSSQGPCLNDAVCEYKSPLLLETWTQPLERANPYYSLVPSSPGMCFVPRAVNREGREVSVRLRHVLWAHGHRSWVGMKPQEICPPGLCSSIIPSRKYHTHGGRGDPHRLSSAVLGAPSGAE